MKNTIKYALQKGLGFDNYLYFFSRHCIRKVSKGTYEKEFRHFIGLLPEEGLVLDIGANIGITAVSMARKRPQIEIHAYEPIAENFKALNRVVSSYKLGHPITTFNLALGNTDGDLKMVMPINGKTRMQGLSRMYDPDCPVKGEIYTVKVRSLDDIYKDKKIVAIKIDVENFEYEVLQGGQQMLENSKPIIYCELWNNSKRNLVFEMMLSMNYSIYTYEEEINDLRLLQKPYTTSSTNFFFINRLL